ncbi:MAG: amino acid permease, partial [Myxococcales bacterium]
MSPDRRSHAPVGAPGKASDGAGAGDRPKGLVGRLGVLSGVGLVVANTVGVGVLTNTGYMAGRLGPREILLAWLVGGVMAISGARCYAAIAHAIPRSGGEYRYLSDLL